MHACPAQLPRNRTRPACKQRTDTPHAHVGRNHQHKRRTHKPAPGGSHLCSRLTPFSAPFSLGGEYGPSGGRREKKGIAVSPARRRRPQTVCALISPSAARRHRLRPQEHQAYCPVGWTVRCHPCLPYPSRQHLSLLRFRARQVCSTLYEGSPLAPSNAFGNSHRGTHQRSVRRIRGSASLAPRRTRRPTSAPR